MPETGQNFFSQQGIKIGKVCHGENGIPFLEVKGGVRRKHFERVVLADILKAMYGDGLYIVIRNTPLGPELVPIGTQTGTNAY